MTTKIATKSVLCSLPACPQDFVDFLPIVHRRFTDPNRAQTRNGGPANIGDLQRSFDNMFNDCLGEDAWRPVFISRPALALLLEKGKKTTGLQRCHGAVIGAIPRAQRFREAMAMASEGVSAEDIWYFCVQHDVTILALKSENDDKRWAPGPDDLVAIPQPGPGERRLFRSLSRSSAYEQEEIEWAQSVAAHV
jgi:hypothetical protein